MIYSLEIARFQCGGTDLTLSEIEDIVDSIEDDPKIEKIRNNLSVIQKQPGVKKIIINMVEIEESNDFYSECIIEVLFSNVDDYLLVKLSI